MNNRRRKPVLGPTWCGMIVLTAAEARLNFTVGLQTSTLINRVLIVQKVNVARSKDDAVSCTTHSSKHNVYSQHGTALRLIDCVSAINAHRKQQEAGWHDVCSRDEESTALAAEIHRWRMTNGDVPLRLHSTNDVINYLSNPTNANNACSCTVTLGR